MFFVTCLGLSAAAFIHGCANTAANRTEPGLRSSNADAVPSVRLGTGMAGGTAVGQLVKPTLEASATPDISPLTLNSVLVYPLETNVGELHAIGKEILDQGTVNLLSKMQVATTLQLLNSDSGKDRDVASAISKTRGQALPLKERALKSGKLLDAQGVLFGVVSRFEDAEGSRLGESGKSVVSFQLFLADVRTGKIVWQANFNESNQPLSENLFRLGNVARQGFQYKSAQQIFEEGLGSAAADLESARKRRS